jgi:hypothetical protein
MPEDPSQKRRPCFVCDIKESHEANALMNAPGVVIAAPMMLMVILHVIAQ